MTTVRKHSRKRDAILECVRSTKAHPAAEWIYAQLKPQIPDLSLGTVYRNLAMFRSEGLIESVGSVSGIERFDGCTEPHSHFICTACGAVEDVEAQALPQALLNHAEKTCGGQVSTYRLSYFGLCSNCRPDTK